MAGNKDRTQSYPAYMARLTDDRLARICDGGGGNALPYESAQMASELLARRAGDRQRTINQCDGCRRGLETRVSSSRTSSGVPMRVHYDSDGHAVQICEAERYL